MQQTNLKTQETHSKSQLGKNLTKSKMRESFTKKNKQIFANPTKSSDKSEMPHADIREAQRIMAELAENGSDVFEFKQEL